MAAMSAAIEINVPFAERIKNFRRYRKLIVTVFSVALALSVGSAVFWPATYRSTATILIEQQEIPQDFVRTMISSFADQRIQVISQRVMTSQNLMRIVERYDLYPWQRRTQAREAVLEKMRDDIKMRMVSANVIDPRSGHPTQATIAFTVGYDSRHPDLALKVANELTSLYLEENLALRAAASRQSASFLTAEADRLQADIQRLTVAIADFKSKHPQGTPEFLQANLQLADRAENELRDLRGHLQMLTQQRDLIQSEFNRTTPTAQIYAETGQRIMSPTDRLKSLKAEEAGLKARYGEHHPDVLRVQREIEGLSASVDAEDVTNDALRRLEDAKSELAKAKARYSPTHPDVIRWSRMVADLEKSIAEMPARARIEKARVNPDNPAYIQLKLQLESINGEIEATRAREVETQSRYDDYQKRLSRAPAVEQEYYALARDLENTQQKYQEVRMKQHEAESSQNLETERKGERFTLIEPPLPPEEPVSPNRPVVFFLGLLVSLALGLGTAIVKESTDPRVRRASDVTAMIGVAPLAVLPSFETAAEVASRESANAPKRKRLIYILVGVVVVIILFVQLFVRPLDILFVNAIRRLGL
jgi:uncharacterized protein involved in exopolysaccharide biosynthesis